MGHNFSTNLGAGIGANIGTGVGTSVGSGIGADIAVIKANALGLKNLTPAADDPVPAPMSFAQSMKDTLYSVDQSQHRANDKMAEVDAGRSDDLVGAMLASQEASLSFSMLMQVRNKVMGAVDELVKLPL